MKIRLDHAGIRNFLRTEPKLKAVVHDAAERVAAAIPDDKGPVVVDDYVTDRQASSVTIKHPAAKIRQTRDGVLTRAAASTGLEVTER